MLMQFIRKYYLKLPKFYKKRARGLFELYLHTSSTVRWLPKNIVSLFLFNKYKDQCVESLNIFERKIFSQNGEDGILEAIFYKIGVTNKYCVEFGVENGSECNTRCLLTCKGWSGLQMDANEDIPSTVKKEYITPENINNLFQKYNVPQQPDLVSIDVDSFDYWIWKALEGYSPRVVVIEYNAAIPVTEPKVLKYDPNVLNKYPLSFGAGLLALTQLGNEKGYSLVACDNRGVNAFFVRNDLIKDKFKIRDIKEIYRSPQYGFKIGGKYVGFSPDEAAVVRV